MASMIWSAFFVHTNGLALLFQLVIHSSSAQVSSSVEQKQPRSRRRHCSANACGVTKRGLELKILWRGVFSMAP